MKSIIYKGFSKRAGRIKQIRSTEQSERRDIIRLYGMFEGDTEITCIEPKTGEVLDILKLNEIFNPIL